MSDPSNDVYDAIRTRHSCRRFTSQSVDRDQIQRMLEAARYAPSGSNIQPWRVYVVAGAVRDAITEDILADLDRNEERNEREYQYYPTQWFEPYLKRRRACGWGLYKALDIERGEHERMKVQRSRNYSFFGAPTGLFFTVDRRLETGSWMDLGIFLQTLMLAARGEGLHTCPQAAFANYHQILRTHLPMDDHEIVACGLSVGYSDRDAPENRFRTERESVEEFSSWHGFG